MTEILMMAQRFKQQNQEKENSSVLNVKTATDAIAWHGWYGALVLMRCRIGLTPQSDVICGIHHEKLIIQMVIMFFKIEKAAFFCFGDKPLVEYLLPLVLRYML